MPSSPTAERGFTLIELSIVLVIIGLMVGGVLVGRDLIGAAAVRAQVSQIEKFNTAVNTFRDKYAALPGDLNQQVATAFGFAQRGSYAGEGDGNGVIEGIWNNQAGANTGIAIMGGETAMFWKDLSAAGLIDGSFISASPNSNLGSLLASGVSALFPQAKIGGGNYVYVYSWYDGPHFGLSAVTGAAANNFYDSSGTSLTVQQAYSIDQKVDDGFPQTGNVVTIYIAGNISTGARIWAAGGGNTGTADTSATVGSATTCYDNSTSSSGTPGVSGNAQHYSLEINNGANLNCALSFKFQ